jgi:hypothetical protein
MLKIETLKRFYNPEVTSIVSIVSEIRSSQKIKEMVEKLRREEGDETAQKAIKLEMPAFTLAEFEKDKPITNQHFLRTSHLLFDIDHLSVEQLRRVLKELKEFAYFHFVSPRGYGVKFVIKLEKPLTKDNYEGNYRHYISYFTDLLGVEIDSQTVDLRRLCLYSHDPKCRLNEVAKAFPVVDINLIKRNANIDVSTLDDEEIADVCKFLSTRKLNYDQYSKVAMALNTLGDKGLDYFLLIGRGDDSPDHRHRDWEKKFKDCSSVHSLTIRTLFWVAEEHGYKRNVKFIKGGKGVKYPFEVLDEGSFYRNKEDNLQWVFGWKEIIYKYDIITNEAAGNKVLLEIDGEPITVQSSSIPSGSLLKSEISKKYPCHFIHTRSDVFFNMLSEYLFRNRTGKKIYDTPGVGKILPDLWNFGNYLIYDGVIQPFTDIFWVTEKKGYLLEQVKEIRIIDNPKLKDKLKRLHYFYGDLITIAIGWAVANLFYMDIHEDVSCFPLLFLHGETGKGKTKLGDLILSLYGVKDPETSRFKSTDFSAIAAHRLKNQTYNFPMFLDEYNSTYYGLMKRLYDGKGRTTALKDHTDNVKQTEVRGGTITAAYSKPPEKEVLNRCVFYDISESVDDRKAAEFNEEFIGEEGYAELSAFAISLASGLRYEEFRAIFKEAQIYFLKNMKASTEALGRISTNYAIVYAGYKILVKHKVIPEWTDLLWWLGQINSTLTYITERNPADLFLSICLSWTREGMYKNMLKLERVLLGGEEHYRLFIDIKNIYPKVKALTSRIKEYFDLASIDELELKRKLKQHKYFNADRTGIIYFDTSVYASIESRGYAFAFDIPVVDSDELEPVDGSIPF